MAATESRPLFNTMKFYNKNNSFAGGEHKALKNDWQKPGSFYIETIGCQQNEYDASRLAIFLKSAGLVESTADESDVIFILACSVRQTAVDRIFGKIKNWTKPKDQKKEDLKRKNSKEIQRPLKILVTSCLTPEDQKRIMERGANYWHFGEINALEKILGKKFSSKSIEQYSNSSYVPIMTGCNNFCSYCIVPYTRGREKSRPVDDIIKEIKTLISYFRTCQYGSRKPRIILLGQNVNSYKIDERLKIKDQKNKKDFTVLLEMINDLPGDFQISFMSNHPKDMTADVINAIATLPKVRKEIHLPLQSGSDKILKLMNRPYTAEEFLKLIKKLSVSAACLAVGLGWCEPRREPRWRPSPDGKVKSKNVKITTDIIVGFPGETEEDFQKTIQICKKVGFSLAYVNKYSPRKGTAAFKLGDPIPWAEKQRRWKILNNLINKK